MTTYVFFFIFIPILAFVLLFVNFIFAPDKPYKEKETPFECGYHSFGQNRTEFTVLHFFTALTFLILTIELLTVYPLAVSIYDNEIVGIVYALLVVFFITLGFFYELGKGGLGIDTLESKHIDNTMYSSIITSLYSCTKINKYNLMCIRITKKQLHTSTILHGIDKGKGKAIYLNEEQLEQLEEQRIMETYQRIENAIEFDNRNPNRYTQDASDRLEEAGLIFINEEHENLLGFCESPPEGTSFSDLQASLARIEEIRQDWEDALGPLFSSVEQRDNEIVLFSRQLIASESMASMDTEMTEEWHTNNSKRSMDDNNQQYSKEETESSLAMLTKKIKLIDENDNTPTLDMYNGMKVPKIIITDYDDEKSQENEDISNIEETIDENDSGGDNEPGAGGGPSSPTSHGNNDSFTSAKLQSDYHSKYNILDEKLFLDLYEYIIWLDNANIYATNIDYVFETIIYMNILCY